MNAVSFINYYICDSKSPFKLMSFSFKHTSSHKASPHFLYNLVDLGEQYFPFCRFDNYVL